MLHINAKQVIFKSTVVTLSTVTLFSSAILPSVSAFADNNVQTTQTSNANNNNNGQNNQNNNNANANSNSQNNGSDNKVTNQHHTLTTPYVVYGAGTDDSIHSQLNQLFQTDSSFKELTATAADYNKYLNHGQDSGTTNSAMISSVAIAPADPGSGIKVNIKKFNGQNNITEVTAQQYAMVAQMAGVTDVTIIVSANRPVSGTSALAGVYKALEQDGANLNPQNTATANQMLGATQPAIDANKDDSSYPGKLMAAIGNVSQQLAQQRQDNQKLATKDDIQNMLNKALQKQGIEDQTSKAQQGQITNALVNFQKSPISMNKNYTKTVGDTIDNVKNSTGSIMNSAKNWANSDEANKLSTKFSSWWRSVVNWFKGIFSHESKEDQKPVNDDKANTSSVTENNSSTTDNSSSDAKNKLSNKFNSIKNKVTGNSNNADANSSSDASNPANN